MGTMDANGNIRVPKSGHCERGVGLGGVQPGTLHDPWLENGGFQGNAKETAAFLDVTTASFSEQAFYPQWRVVPKIESKLLSYMLKGNTICPITTPASRKPE